MEAYHYVAALWTSRRYSQTSVSIRHMNAQGDRRPLQLGARLTRRWAPRHDKYDWYVNDRYLHIYSSDGSADLPITTTRREVCVDSIIQQARTPYVWPLHFTLCSKVVMLVRGRIFPRNVKFLKLLVFPPRNNGSEVPNRTDRRTDWWLQSVIRPYSI